MSTVLQIAHCLAGFITLAEALNKLERTSPFAAGLSGHQRVVDGLKCLAWVLLALGAAGAVATPILVALGASASPLERANHDSPSLAETAVLLGFAILIVRTRVKEG